MDVIIIPVKGNSVFAFGVSCFFSSLCPPGTAAAAVAVAVGCCFGRRKLQFPKTRSRPPPLPFFKIWAAKC